MAFGDLFLEVMGIPGLTAAGQRCRAALPHLDNVRGFTQPGSPNVGCRSSSFLDLRGHRAVGQEVRWAGV
jgi:hypothetical protein